MRRLLLLLPIAVFASLGTAAARGQTATAATFPDERVEYDIDKLAEQLARMRGTALVIDDALYGKKIRANLHGLSYPAIEEALDFFGVTVIDDAARERPLLRVVHQRNAANLEIPPVRLGEGDAIPSENQYVEKTFRVRYGNGNAIQIAIRQLQTRDSRRMGNVSYMRVSDGETIIITDLAPAVRQYTKILAELDRPPEKLGNVRVDLELWQTPTEAPEGNGYEKRTRAQGAVRLAESSGLFDRSVPSSTTRMADSASGGSTRTSGGIVLSARLFRPGGGATSEVELSALVPPPDAHTSYPRFEVTRRVVNLGPGWTLVQSSDRFALFARAAEE